jgi:hypothetical protein
VGVDSGLEDVMVAPKESVLVGPDTALDVAVDSIPVEMGVSVCVRTQIDFSLQEYPKGQQVFEPERSRPQTGREPSRSVEWRELVG